MTQMTRVCMTRSTSRPVLQYGSSRHTLRVKQTWLYVSYTNTGHLTPRKREGLDARVPFRVNFSLIWSTHAPELPARPRVSANTFIEWHLRLANSYTKWKTCLARQISLSRLICFRSETSCRFAGAVSRREPSTTRARNTRGEPLADRLR